MPCCGSSAMHFCCASLPRSVSFLVMAASAATLHLQALPACIGSEQRAADRLEQSTVWLQGEVLCLQLRSRKNLPEGSGILKRACSCRASPAICPVHVLWHKFLSQQEVGSKPWAGINPAAARCCLRAVLESLQASLSIVLRRAKLEYVQVNQAQSYSLHDFRRGHAKVRPLPQCFPVRAMECYCLQGHAERRKDAWRNLACRPMEKRRVRQVPR